MDAFERICDWRSALLEVDTGVALDAKAIRQQVESRSNYFHSLGITHQTRVVILKSSSIDFFIDLAAVWRQRAIAIVVDSNQTPTELLSVINDIRPHFTINSTSVQRCAVEPVTALSL
ncbi:MAG: AMP-binding protein, partial [Bdellovibrionaceae bacterium]|nr:AMP-binding protein [Pseudobdellovibrionaceae bacterium]